MLQLFLDKNQLTTLPDAIGNMAALRELNVRQNQLTSLPEALGKLKNLEGLFLSENQLEALPDLSGCSAARAQRQTWPRRSAPICINYIENP